MANFKFSPKTKTAQEVEKKLVIERLPAWAQETEQIQKYFDDAVQQWFSPEQQKTIDGYVGNHGGPNSAGKTFIDEITNARTAYQLAPAMVSTDATNSIQSMITYTDLVDYMNHNGSITENTSRLLSGRSYCWAPPINPDMLINYSNYYWDASNDENMREPDYIVMERGARDGNLWSVSNHWYPVTYKDGNDATVTITNDDIESGKFVQAQRPIIEYVKDMELYNHGRTSRGVVDLVSYQTLPEDIMFRDASANIRVDGQLIRNGDRILFTSINNIGENNRIYKVIIERKNNVNVYGLTLDVDEQTDERKSGEPIYNDSLRVRRGTKFGNSTVTWTNTEWVQAQRKFAVNQLPMFNLYDKSEVLLNDSSKYHESSFTGSSIFAVKIDNSFARDTVYGMNIRKDEYGSFSYENHIESDSFTYTSNGEATDISGMRFYKVTSEQESDDQYFSDWREAAIPTRQYVSQIIEPTIASVNASTGASIYNTEYELASTVGENPTGINYPIMRVDISGDVLDSTQYSVDDTTITITADLDDESVISVLYFSGDDVPNTDLGNYEVPSNLKNNANNEVITDINESSLADHFYDIIQSQEDFEGSAVGINNYYNSKRDLSVGRRIVQHDASLLPLMAHASSERMDIIKSIDFAKSAYNSFKNKFITKLNEENNKGITDIRITVDNIIKAINVGKSNEFAFWLSGLGTTTTTTQPFIPPTPQYLGIVPTYQPRVRVVKEVNGVNGIFNVSHTGALSRAFSVLYDDGSVYNDVRDDVLYQLEMDMYNSIHNKFKDAGYVPALSEYDVRPGVYRNTDYTAEEYKRVSLRSFEQWVITNSVDYQSNTTYDATNWKTWNYTGSRMYVDGSTVHGSYMSMYLDMFDTIEPHTKPWEMIGFKIKPLWWDLEYTKSVIIASGERAYIDPEMVVDLQNGYIRDGIRKGTDSRFARPGLATYWPVNMITGELNAPYDGGAFWLGQTQESKQLGDVTVYARYLDVNLNNMYTYIEKDAEIESNTIISIDEASKRIRFELDDSDVTAMTARLYNSTQSVTITGTQDGDVWSLATSDVFAWDAEDTLSLDVTVTYPWGDEVRNAASIYLTPAADVTASTEDSVITISASGFSESAFNVRLRVVSDSLITSAQTAQQQPLIISQPIESNASIDWAFGDIGPVEYSYMNSNHYGFELATTLYRAKPAQWVNYFWDTTNYSLVNLGSQTHWLHDNTDRRLYVDRDTTTVHGENQTRIIGYQMWVADYLKHNHINITSSYGDIMRGTGVKLVYRLGGFSKNENLTFVSDSFGLVSQENQQLSLLRSSVRRQEVLSGVKITYTGKEFTVSGYDSVSPYFKYLKPVVSGKRYQVSIGNLNLVQYQEHETTVSELRYDTKLRTVQDVYNFLVGYGEYLEQQGWIFEDMEDGEFFDWRYVAAGFVNWSQFNNITEGSFVTLTPSGNSIKFAAEHGNISSLAQFTGGSWTLIDDDNQGIGMHEITVSRIGNIINARLNDEVPKRIMLLRLNIDEYEHAVAFDNTTIFNDVMYLPKFGLHQPRLRVYGNISDGWNGRLEAPGFMIVDNSTLPNFEKLVNDFTKYYDGEKPGSSVELNNLARHVIGYQSREYLRRLILNERSQVDFYKGYIKEKGTVQSFEKILRTSKNLKTPNYKVIEEWAFKAGEYGDVNSKQRIEFVLRSNELKQDPQYATFDSSAFYDAKEDDIVTYFGNEGEDSRWITRTSETQSFPMHSREGNILDFPSSGPVNINDVDITVTDIFEIDTARDQYVSANGTLPQTMWMLDNQGTWELYDLVTTDSYARASRPITSALSEVDLSAPHTIVDNAIMFLYAPGKKYSDITRDVYFRRSYVLPNTIVQINTSLDKIFYNSEDGISDDDAPRLYYWAPRFVNSQERSEFIEKRETDIVDINVFNRPVIYNRSTNQTETYLTLWDPMQGVIPGIADAEINFKSRRDPAMYNNIDRTANSWGSQQVGQVWWDTSTSKYLDYTQPVRDRDGIIDEDATQKYVRQNWGKMLPGSEITLYEWVRSPVNPVDWDNYVTAQSSLNKTRGIWVPSGEAIQDNWCEISEYDTNSNEFKTYYYFWVKDAITVPNIKTRKRNISELARIITDPSSLNLPWFAPINENDFIVSGINSLITDDDSVLQITYNTQGNNSNVHKQWRLFQEGSDYIFDDDMWQNMVDSLVGETLPNNNAVISPAIYPTSQLGNEYGKTWFKDISEARREFVAASNQFFKSTNVVSDLFLMNTIFNYEEQSVNPFERKVTVVQHNSEYVLRVERPEHFSDNDSVVLSSTGALPTPIESSITYFLQRVPGESDLFIVKGTPNAIRGITITDKGIGDHTIIRSVDANAALSQALVMSEFWDFVDWYADGYSNTTPYTEVVSTAAADAQNFSLGDVIRVTDTSGNWTLYVKGVSRNISIWETVGRNNSTIVLNDKLHSNVMFNEDGSATDQEVIIRRAIRLLCTGFTTSQSRIVFPMVYYVHNEQKVVDWVFKTSYVTILGIDKNLDNSSVTHNDAINDVLEYINEVKPYRTKIRGSVDQRTSDSEIIAASMRDTDNSMANHEAYLAEWDKPEADRDFSKIPTNFRQHMDILFYDHVTNIPDVPLLVNANTAASKINSLFSINDEANMLPAEIMIANAPNVVFNGIYTELTDSTQVPVFDVLFHPYGSKTILIDHNAKIYRRVVDGENYYIWKLVGSGWIISSTVALNTDWYYEDTSVDTLSQAVPQNVEDWLWSEKLAGVNRGKSSTNIVSTLNVDSRINLEKTMNVGRPQRNDSYINQQAADLLYTELSKHASVTLTDWNSVLGDFLIPSGGQAYFDVTTFKSLCNERWSLYNEETILDIISVAFNEIYFESQYLNTANRIKIYNPDATQDYIDEVLNAGFKGCQVINQPNMRGAIGYDAQPIEATDGYYQWSYDLYERIYNQLVDSGMSLFDATEKMRQYGFAEVTKYVPYIDTITETDEKSVRIASVNEFGLNAEAWDASNPLQNENLPLIDGFVNDIANFDNFGYDNLTRTMVYRGIDPDTYIFDINELQLESDMLGKIIATISNHRPDQHERVDYGIMVADGGYQLGTQIGTLNGDYGLEFFNSNEIDFKWDFGIQYGNQALADSNGSFSVEATLVKHPSDDRKVIVSVPRNINTIATTWNDEHSVFTDADTKLYPFTLDSVSNIDTFVIGKHTLVDNDTVILFAQEDELGLPSGARFNEPDTLYTVKVVNSTTVQLIDDTGVVVSLDAQYLFHAQEYLEEVSGLYYDIGSRAMFSMLHVIPPQSQSTVRIDCLNYSDIYGRFMNGSKLFNEIYASGSNIINSKNHGLKTGDTVLFSSTQSPDTGDVKLNTEYFVIRVDDHRFSITDNIDNAVIGTNRLNVNNGIKDCSLAVINFWIASTVTDVRRQNTWHTDARTKSFDDRLELYINQFDKDVENPDGSIVRGSYDLIDYATDEIVDQGFARPSIDDGSMRELVRLNMQEQLSITVFQDERGTATTSNNVFDDNGIHMYNRNGTTQYAFRLLKSDEDRVCKVNSLADDNVGSLLVSLWYNDTTIRISGGTFPSQGTVEINNEYIAYNSLTVETDGSMTLRGLRRGSNYSSENNRVAIGSTVVLVDGPNQRLSRAIAQDDVISDTIVDQENYDLASTILFDMDGNSFEELRNATSDFSNELKEDTASFNVINTL